MSFPTNEYKHQSDLLWQQNQEGSINYNSYMTALKSLVEQEVHRYSFLYENQAREAAWNYEQQRENRMKELAKRKEEQEAAAAARAAEVAKRKEEQEAVAAARAAEAARLAKLSPAEKYRDNEWGTIANYRNEAKFYRSWHNRLQAVVIAGSILVTGVVGVGLAKWISLSLSIMVSLAAGFIGYYKYKERSINLQQAADAIEREFKAAELGIHEYKDKKTPQERMILLAERVEWLKEEQQKRALQLEQPPEVKMIHN